MRSTMPSTVVFDIGNVLLRWDMRALFSKIVPADRLDWFMEQVCPVSWHGQLDAGLTYAEAIAQRVALYPDHAETIAHYDPRWQETIVGAIDGSVRLLEALRSAGVPTYAITNFPAEKFDETCELYPFLKGFLGVVVSGRERLVKPDPAIFSLFLDRYGLVAEDCVFIDDSPANTQAARALGFSALQFTDPGRLAVELRALGLPV
jgi:2-haloacid dehalogenase